MVLARRIRYRVFIAKEITSVKANPINSNNRRSIGIGSVVIIDEKRFRVLYKQEYLVRDWRKYTNIPPRIWVVPEDEER